jgi:ribosomal protein S18 acetylase RimI-like enzyme
MLIRLADIRDLEQVAELFDLYRQFYEKPSDLQGARAFLRERMEHEESIIFVADAQGKLVGFTQLYPLFSSVGMKKQWVINDLYVKMEARKSGAGEMLMREAMNFGTRNGSRGLTLQTAVTNVTAQRLYEKLGWKKNETYLTYNFYP